MDMPTDQSEPGSSTLNHSNNRRNKRFQACVSCRATKTKCLPSEQSDTCQTCLRAGRPCVMPGPPKPRMKSAQKFSELEKKIEILTNALANKDPNLQEISNVASNRQNMQSMPITTGSAIQSPVIGRTRGILMQEVSPDASLSPELLSILAYNGSDVVEEGLIERDTATSLFLHWRTNMSRFTPLIFFRTDMDADQVRKANPTLFLAVLSIASASIYPSLANQLTTRFTAEIGQKVFVRGTQSVDIILAALLFSQFYFQPGETTNLAPSQFVHAAIAMASDLGLHLSAKYLHTMTTYTALEAARVCISEWYATSLSSSLLTRNSPVKYTPDLEKYIEILAQEEAQSDRWQYSLLKIQQITESASLLLDAHESKDEHVFDEPSTQYKIKMLQQQLTTWERDVPENVDYRFKQHCVHSTSLQIHAIAVRCFVRKMSHQMQAGAHVSSVPKNDLMGLTPAHFNCLARCLESTKAIFDVYLSFDTSLARSLPNSFLSWNVNAAVLLIKLGHFGEVLASLGQWTGNGDDAVAQMPFQTTVVYYLDAIANKMDSISQDGYLPQARPYVKVVRKLKPYYLQKRSICISSSGEGVIVENDESHVTMSTRSSSLDRHSRPSYSRTTSDDVRMQRQDLQPMPQYGHSPRQPASSSRENVSHSGWTPTSEFSPGAFQSPPFPASFGDHLGNQHMNMNAAYDPYTYANTNWASLTLGQDEIQQLDSFMWAEEDTAWMQSLL